MWLGRIKHITAEKLTAKALENCICVNFFSIAKYFIKKKISSYLNILPKITQFFLEKLLKSSLNGEIPHNLVTRLTTWSRFSLILPGTKSSLPLNQSIEKAETSLLECLGPNCWTMELFSTLRNDDRILRNKRHWRITWEIRCTFLISFEIKF